MNVSFQDVGDAISFVPGQTEEVLDIAGRIDDHAFLTLWVSNHVRIDGQARYKTLIKKHILTPESVEGHSSLVSQ
jgi:hypothetical protein